MGLFCQVILEGNDNHHILPLCVLRVFAALREPLLEKVVSKRQKKRYSKGMDIAIKFNKAAFKHGIAEADIRMAFDNVLYDERLDDSDGEDEINARYLLIGFDRNANLLEILYNVIDDDTLKVFHAMRCSNTFLPLIKNKE